MSAYNRERELLIGKNAKGRAPTFRLDPRRLGIILDFGGPEQRYIVLRDHLTNDTPELALQSFRVVPGRIAITRAIGRPPITTAELEKLFKPAPTRRPLIQPRQRHVPMPGSSAKAATPRVRPEPAAMPESGMRAIDPREALRRLLARRQADAGA